MVAKGFKNICKRGVIYEKRDVRVVAKGFKICKRGVI